eukprot:scaffold67251_cov27-Tisochrysis_lutea.AAC.1
MASPVGRGGESRPRIGSGVIAAVHMFNYNYRIFDFCLWRGGIRRAFLGADGQPQLDAGITNRLTE